MVRVVGESRYSVAWFVSFYKLKKSVDVRVFVFSVR